MSNESAEIGHYEPPIIKIEDRPQNSVFESNDRPSESVTRPFASPSIKMGNAEGNDR